MNMMIRCGSTNSRAQGNTGPPSKPVFICTVGSRFTLRLHIKDFTLTCVMFRAPHSVNDGQCSSEKQKKSQLEP